jgi:photosystem II stability/assembly factor-like uncharacterized protein
MDKDKVVIATGGTMARLWISTNKGKKWNAINTPMTPTLKGEGTSGIFSIAFADDEHVVIVGGDYKKESLKFNHVFYTDNDGKSWLSPANPTGGYRECVEFIDNRSAVATGPNGTDISINSRGSN